MMNEIRQMIENGESETTEFKENFDKEETIVIDDRMIEGTVIEQVDETKKRP